MEGTKGRGAWLAWGAVALVAGAAVLSVQVRQIANTMPYPRQLDERFVTDSSMSILQTGDLNPHMFRYGNLPMYVTAACMALGFIDAAAHGEVEKIESVGSMHWPYYSLPRMIWPAKLLHTTLALLAVVLLAAAMAGAARAPALVALSLPVALASPFYFYTATAYINIDVFAVFFAAAAIATSLRNRGTGSLWLEAVVPGALCGLAAACKINAALCVVAPMMAILLYGRCGRAAKCGAAAAAMFAAFVAASPYAVLDLPHFLNDIAAEARHYAEGHSGHTRTPGLDHAAAYLSELRGDTGTFGFILGLLGAAALLVRDWRRMAVVLAYPLVLLAYMSLQSTSFSRNLLVLYLLYPALITAGAFALYRIIAAAGARLAWLDERRGMLRAAAACLVLAACLALLPLRGVSARWNTLPDSRTLALDWIVQQVPQPSTIIVPEELSVDTRKLAENYDVQTWRFADLDAAAFQAKLDGYASAYLLLPLWGFDQRRPSDEPAADRLNTLGKDLPRLATWGVQAVGKNYTHPVFHGDPKFAVALHLPAARQPGDEAALRAMPLLELYTMLSDERRAEALPPALAEAAFARLTQESSANAAPIDASLSLLDFQVTSAADGKAMFSFLFGVGQPIEIDLGLFVRLEPLSALAVVTDELREQGYVQQIFETRPATSAWVEGSLQASCHAVRAPAGTYKAYVGFFEGPGYIRGNTVFLGEVALP